MSAQLFKKDSITKLRADMDRQSQQLDKILAAHNQNSEDHQLTSMDKSFNKTVRKEDVKIGLGRSLIEYQTMDNVTQQRRRDGAISAMLVTEHSADAFSRQDK